MFRNPSTCVRSAVAFLLLIVAACADEKPKSTETDAGQTDGTPANAEEPSEPSSDEDYTTYDVEYRDDAVVLEDAAAVKRSLLHADFAAGTLTFASDMPGIDALNTGTSALLGGVGVYHILGREENDEGIVLKVESGVLTDVVEEAHIAFRRHLVAPSADDRVGLGIDDDAAETVRSVQKGRGSYKDGELSYSGKLGDFDTTMSLKKAADGILLSLGAKWKGDVAIVNAAVSATLHDMTNETEVVITSREVRLVDIRFVGVDGEAHINAGAVEVGADTKITIPARLALPVMVGPIPFTVALGTSLEFSSTLTSNTTATVKASTKFKGGAGVKIDGKKVTWFSQFDPPELNVEHAEQVGTVGAGVGFLLNFPELSVGVGYPAVANAEAFVRFKTEVVTNMSVEYSAAGPFPVLSGSCIETGTNFGASYGGTVSFIGINVAEDEHQLFGRVGDKLRSGNSCKQ
jgi:hypothetical protein